MYAVTDKQQQQRGLGPTPKNTAGRDRQPVGSLDILQRHAGNAYLANAQSGLSSGELRIQRDVERKEEEVGKIQRASVGPSDMEDRKEEEDQGPLQRSSIEPSDMEDRQEDEEKRSVFQAKRVVGPSDDIYEQEADRVAEQVVANKTAPLSVSSVNSGQLQRQEAPDKKTDEEKYKEVPEKIAEALLETPLGQQLLEAVKQGTISTWLRGSITGAAATGVVSALYATHEKLPVQIPELSLDRIIPGLSVKLTYQGPVDAPTDASITFKYAEQPSERRSGNYSSSPPQPGTSLGLDSFDLVHSMRQRDDARMMAEILRPSVLTPNPNSGSLGDRWWKSTLPQNPSSPKSWSPPSQTNEPRLHYYISPLRNSGIDDLLTGRLANEPTPNQPVKPELQRKLSIGTSNDPLEQEADRVAGQVLAAPANPAVSTAIPSIQRSTGKAAGAEATAPASVDRALSSSGRPLEPAVRQYMEPRFGHDFSHVRVHTGDAAEQSAREVNAHAYTAGHNIVSGSGRFEPETHEGRRLLAHELTHVVQQRGGAPAQVRREAALTKKQRADFGSMYRRQNDGSVQSHLNINYNTYKSKLHETEASSKAGGHAFHEISPITREELLTVFKDVADEIDIEKKKFMQGRGIIEEIDEEGVGGGDSRMAVSDKEGSDNESSKTGVSEKGSDNASNKMGGIKKSGSGKEFDQQTGLEDTIDFYVEKLNQSFEIFKINTVEAQAAYIANAYVESDQFRYMTETQKAVKTNKPYASDPRNITLDTTYLSSPARGNNYKSGGPIHPVGEEDWQQSLIGRGPLQVTNRENYIQALAVMEKRAEELERDDPYSQEAKDLREAIDNIKTDPREAANPKYAFMFSAAFMKMSDDHGIRGDEKATKGNVTSWMGTQWPKQEKVKMDAYGKAKDMLMVKWDEDQRKVNENMMKSNMDTNEENMRWEEKGYGDYESKTNEGVG